MTQRHIRNVPARAHIAPVHRGPQAMSPNAIGLGSAPVHAPNAALLIDFDNVTMGIRSDLQTELRNLLSSDIVHGKVAVQRAYADWRRYPQYIVPLSEASIDLIFAPAYGSSKKNATDIRLAIDAMELVFTRPEIGTIILLSGDSDFSSLVIKLKEYGKYVIGVGIRESSSDLLVQNCDEYYSYNALAGLVKSGESDETRKYDPWELVAEAVTRMQRNGDVMRSDRLKQVMQEIDSSFDEKNLGISKFSRFCMEAQQKGLLHVTKLENGQLDVAPPRGKVAAESAVAGAPARPASDVAPERSADADAPAEAREGRGRRGRRGGRGRKRGDRSDATPVNAGAEGAMAEQEPAALIATAAAVMEPTVEPIAEPMLARREVPATHSAPRAAAPVAALAAATIAATATAGHAVGLAGIRLTRDEAFSLVRDAVAALASGDDAMPSEAVRQKAFVLLGRDSESLSERNFARILRDAHDADIVDLRKRGDAFEVAAAASVPSVAAQLEVKEAALKAVADAGRAAAPPAPRGMGPRGARTGRTGVKSGPPPKLLLVGVVDDTPAAEPADTEETTKPRRTRKPRARKPAAEE